jgi:hypothetical protein
MWGVLRREAGGRYRRDRDLLRLEREPAPPTDFGEARGEARSPNAEQQGPKG